MTIAAERITAIIFDEQTPPQKTGIAARLSAMFGQTPDTKPRHLSLREARTRLIAEGLKTETAYIITNGAQNMLAEDGIHLFLARAMFGGNKDMIYVNNTDWSDAHYLGVKITDPKMDIAADKDFIAQLRENFLRDLSEWLHSPASSPTEKPANPHA